MRCVASDRVAYNVSKRCNEEGKLRLADNVDGKAVHLCESHNREMLRVIDRWLWHEPND